MALARKLAVIAWAMLRDEKDWDTQHMISVTESYGKMPATLKESLTNMKPKENSDQRKARHRREAREAKQAEATQATENSSAKPTSRKAKSARPAPKSAATTTSISQPKTSQSKPKRFTAKQSPSPTTKPRRTRKPVSLPDA